ncbi:MAG: hypothetical protein RBS39_00105 [Phycisphaerales bacterium]|jgi:hypothetical protein|nr:hypothetical protein [Phycisphaerales bacterium]
MPDERGLPTTEELAKLPAWAQLTLAARSARRVQPLFDAVRMHAGQRSGHSIEQCIATAEEYAAVGKNIQGSLKFSEGVRDAIRSAWGALAGRRGSSAAESAYYCGWAADLAGAGFPDHSQAEDARHYIGKKESFENLQLPLEHVPTPESFVDATARDMVRLNVQATMNWRDPDELGRLWPEDVAPGWRDNSRLAFDRTRPPDALAMRLLPLGARIALHARVARRFQPFFEHSWQDAPHDLVRYVDEAIAFAENWRTENFSKKSMEFAKLAQRAMERAGDSGHQIAYASASLALKIASMAAQSDPPEHGISLSLKNTHPVSLQVTKAIWNDYDFLRVLVRQSSPRWMDETPVPAELLGPLWPDGEPEGWPNSDESDEKMTATPLSLYFDMDEFSPQQVADMIGLLSDLYAEIGGDKLVIDGMSTLVLDRVGGVR